MDRRAVGVTLVVLALAAVMVWPALSGIRSTGVAVPVALASPPAVGDCVSSLSDAAPPGSLPPQLPVSAVRFGSCRGEIVGEVVAYWPTQLAQSAAPRSRRAGPCYQPLAQYTGLRVPGTPTEPLAAADAEQVSWRPVIAFQAYLVSASDLERRAGRDWSACVIGTATGQVYRGSLRGAYLNDALPTVFGSCWIADGPGLLIGPGDCLQPHTAQLVATGFGGGLDRVPAADVSASCSRIAARLMDTQDPTRDGQLTIVADRMARLSRTWTGNPSSLGCFVTTTGSRQLAGLLLGLGDRPIPFLS
jgi:hypothetical protein